MFGGVLYETCLPSPPSRYEGITTGALSNTDQCTRMEIMGSASVLNSLIVKAREERLESEDGGNGVDCVHSLRTRKIKKVKEKVLPRLL